MNWEAIGAIGEIISAIGVIGTLIYLALQIRTNTAESRLIAIGEISRDYTSALQHIAGDEKMTNIWATALADFESLPPEEQSRALMMHSNITRVLENAYIQFLEGRMPSKSWEGYEKILRQGVSTPLFSKYWELRREMHNQDFQNLMNSLLEDPDARNFF
jgi:hypothetical protein